MGKCMGVSTALLLIATVGSMCNLCVPAVWAQNPLVPGSLFINCGSNASYVDNVTKIPWMPDDQYITTGLKAKVPNAYYFPDFSELATVRYFPDSAHPKDCYSLPVTPNNTYQIRATFFWGEYDNGAQTSLPKFELAVDGTIVDSNFINDQAQFQYKEYRVSSQTNVTFLCLSRDPSSNTNPFISAISLVPLALDPNCSQFLLERFYLHTQFRWNFGTTRFLRYPDDPYDNYWDAQQTDSTSILASNPPLQNLTGPEGLDLPSYPPRAVLNTALTTNGTMTIVIPFTYSYFWRMNLYCFELDPSANATSRQFYFSIQGYPTVLIDPANGRSWDSSGDVPFIMTLYQNSTTATPLGPMVNALEVYEVLQEQMALLTKDQDALAIEGIKASYSQLAEWTGDPCLPYPHPWVKCNTTNVTFYSPFVIAVNLSGYNLTGPISPSFGMLTDLTSLALDSNKLDGFLPDFSKFANLNTLNLSHNQLVGSIPPSIWDISTLSVIDLSENDLYGNLVPNIDQMPCPTFLKTLSLKGNNFNGSFPSNLLNCSSTTLQEINFDHNNFSGIMNMLTWDQDYLSNGIFISMVNNSISGLQPSWDDKRLIYSPILLGGNPICNNLKASSNPQISYHQQLNCRYNNTVLNILAQSNSQEINKKLIWILSTTLPFSVILVGVICVIIFWKYRINTIILREMQKEFEKQQVQPTLYSYNVLKLATRDFHHDNELGRGGFGVVYKGSLVDRTNLAVKLLTTKSHQGIDDFLNEVVAITGITHKNLVKLKGCCLHRTQRLLVYEFLENKDLAQALWGGGIDGTSFLDWPTRLKICVGVAHGLAYLHEDLQLCIIHRDIKASNILLDKNFNAKITDFGLARIFSEDQSQLFTELKVGTLGYISPEYATYGELSTKIDVYSFGVLLLEIVSGRKSMDYTLPTSKINLVKWAYILQGSNTLNDLIDQSINNHVVADEVLRVINVALLCVQIEPTKRPLMSHVVAMLEGKIDILNSQSFIPKDISPLFTSTSTTEKNHLLAYPMLSNYNDNIELTNLNPR